MVTIPCCRSILEAKVTALSQREVAGSDEQRAARAAEATMASQVLEHQQVLKTRGDELLAAQHEARRQSSLAEVPSTRLPRAFHAPSMPLP